MESSDNAFEMRLLIGLSDDTANIALFWCFSIFKDSFLIAWYTTTQSNPITIDTAYIPITAGAATIVDRRPTPVIPNPIAVTSKQLSITPIILTPLLYFILGFHSKLYISGIHDSDNMVNILTINSILVNIYIISGCYVNGSTQPIIYSFFANVSSLPSNNWGHDSYHHNLANRSERKRA